MDYEKALICKVLQEKSDTKVAEAGITPDYFLDPNNRKVWQTLVRHKTQYGQVPTISAMRLDHPEYKFIKIADSLDFLIDRMRNQHVLSLIQDGVEAAVDAYDANDGAAATGALATALSAISIAVPNMRDVDLTTTGEERLEKYRAIKSLPGGLLGTPSGFWTIDRATQGFQPEQLVTFVGPPKAGKALALDTPLPTPTGWTTMGAVQVGDHLLDEQGHPCRVTATSPVWRNRECYRVISDDGAEVVADESHEWVARLDRRSPEKTHETHVLSRTRSKRAQIRMQRALVLPESDLPVDPYLLGVWLGDGESDGGRITTADVEIVEAFRSGGYEVTNGSGKYGYGILGLKAQLRELGVLGNKHVPAKYLRASLPQRLSLLQGLVDTDGYINPRQGRVEFCSTNESLARAVVELVFSLGSKAIIKESRATLYGKDCGPRWRVFFRLDGCARLPRKAILARSYKTKTARYVRAVRTTRQDTRCVEVDSPSHMYLAGPGMLPTHNSTLLLLAAMEAHKMGKHPLFIGFEMSNDEQAQRLDAINARVDHKKLRNGTLSKEEMARLERSIHQFSDMAPFHLSSDSLSATTLTGVMGKVDTIKPDILFVDGLYLMDDENGEKKGSSQALTNLTRGFKRMAQVKQIPVVVTTQVLTWKMSKTKGVTADSIGYSSSFAQDSDTILGVQTMEDMKDTQKLSVVLARNCPPMSTLVRWEWDTGTFEEMEGEVPDDDSPPAY